MKLDSAFLDIPICFMSSISAVRWDFEYYNILEMKVEQEETAPTSSRRNYVSPIFMKGLSAINEYK
jgi:hypothetical protein